MADKRSEIVGGQTEFDKVVLVSFRDRATFTAPAKSSDYTMRPASEDCQTGHPNLFMCNDSHEDLRHHIEFDCSKGILETTRGRADSAVDAHAAVDMDRLTGQIGGVITDEEGHHGSDVLTDAADSLEWHRAKCTFEVLRSDVLPELHPG